MCIKIALVTTGRFRVIVTYCVCIKHHLLLVYMARLRSVREAIKGMRTQFVRGHQPKTTKNSNSFNKLIIPLGLHMGNPIHRLLE